MSITDDFADHAALFDERQRRAGPAPAQLSEYEIEARKNRPSVYVNQGPISVGPQGTTFHEAQSVNVLKEHYNEAVKSGSIVASAVSQGGSPRAPSEIGPQDLVWVEGTQITAQLAERMGYLTRDAGGFYRDAQEQPKEEAPKAPEGPAEDPVEALPHPEMEAMVAALGQGVSPHTQLSGLAQLAESGIIDHNIIRRAASEMKVEPSELASMVKEVVTMFRGQAAHAVQKAGVSDLEGFFHWANAHASDKLTRAIERHGMERTTAGYVGMVTDYFVSLADTNPEGLLNADFGDPRITARKGPNGAILLNLPGAGEVEWKSAIRQGIVKVGK